MRCGRLERASALALEVPPPLSWIHEIRGWQTKTVISAETERIAMSPLEAERTSVGEFDQNGSDGRSVPGSLLGDEAFSGRATPSPGGSSTSPHEQRLRQFA